MIAMVVDFGAWLLRPAICAVLLAVIGRCSLIVLRDALRLRRFASWRDIGGRKDEGEGDPGLLEAHGCLLGAVRRHAWSEIQFLRAPWDRTLLLGVPGRTERAIRAALEGWTGALVYVDSQGGSKYLNRQDVIHFAPGRIDGAGYNPMLAIRRGVHAWTDAKVLAAALLLDASGAAIETLAGLILDHLHTAKIDERNLAGLRRRLFDPEGAFAALHCNVHEEAFEPDAWSQHPEIMRLSKYLDQNPDSVSKAWRAIDAALHVFSDGRVQCATGYHQIDLGALMMDDQPSTLVVELPSSDQKSMGPIIAAVLAQLVTTYTEARKLDSRGRIKDRSMLLVIDDAGVLPLVPLLRRRLRAAQDCDLYVLIAAQDIGDLIRPFGMGILSTGDELMGQFDSIAAIGPQKPATSRMLSAAAGTYSWFRWVRRDPRGWKDWVSPKFEKANPPVVPAEEYERAPLNRTHLFIKDSKPICGGGILAERGKPEEVAISALPAVVHDWTADPVPQPDIVIIEPVAPPAKAKPQSEESRTAQGELSLSTVVSTSRMPNSPHLRKMLGAARPGVRRN